METPQLLTRKIAASMAGLALLFLTGSALADNTGLGGTITYTDPTGSNPVSSPPYVGGYVVHTFTSNGPLILPTSVGASVLVVGGGGGGGGKYGCGGGAGGLIYTNLALSSGTYSATVGAGGGGTAGNTHGANGANSVFSTLTALGGGGGGDGYLGNTVGQAGGSGGGGGGGSSGFTGGAGAQPASPSGGYGNNGETGSGSIYGGGGGAGAAATSASGGAGLPYSISGVSAYYAGGGGGLNGAGTTATGGGGNGGSGNLVAGGNGAANTGGGGGAGWNATGGTGGSGVIIVSYPYVPNPPLSVVVSSPTNGAAFLSSSPLTTTAYVAGGVGPYSVTYYYKLASAPSYASTAAVGPADDTSTFAQPLGPLSASAWQVYATVTDSTTNTVASATNNFTVFAAGNTGLGGTIVYTDPNGNNPVSAPPYAGGYVVHEFMTNDVLTLPSAVSADVLVVAGGGGGGGRFGCGGGAGGLIYTNLALAGGSYNATVGTGGNGTAGNNSGVDGNNSLFSTLTALGGGGGGDGYLGSVAGLSGGSGGGGGGGSANFGAGTATQPASACGGYGNNGFTSGDGSTYGGGGGAGAAASSANGGPGLAYAISGASTYYAGGAGGLNGLGTTTSGGGGNGGLGDLAPGANGAPNTGGGGGGGWNATGGSGGSGIIIVRYPYLAHPPLSVAVLSPAAGQSFLMGSAIPATAYVAGGVGPYSVTYHFKLTAASSYTAASVVGPFDDTSIFAQTLGTLPVNNYEVYATVTDSATNTVSSPTNAFAVSLTTSLPVQDANFETPGVLSSSLGWAYINDVWNPGDVNSYEQNSLSMSPNVGNEQFTNTCPGGVDWYALLNGNTVSLTQDLLTNVTVGDTLSVTFYGGRGLATSQTADGGVFTATLLVGSTPYNMDIDTTGLTNGTWQSYTMTEVIANSGDLSLQFSAVSGDPWLDNVSAVSRTLPTPSFAGISVAGTTLTLTATGIPNGPWTLLQSTNLALPLSQWTTNTTGTYDGSGNLSATLVDPATNAQEFYILQ